MRMQEESVAFDATMIGFILQLQSPVTESGVPCVTHHKMSLTAGLSASGVHRIHDAIVSETLAKTITTAKDVT